MQRQGEMICGLCPRECRLSEGGIGACGARMCRNGGVGEIRPNYYAAVNVDPIEKKPLYHFLPGTTALSLGGFGCNLMCRGCQNASISRVRASEGEGLGLAPEAVVDMALREGASSIAYTYNEPIVWWETMQSVARLAHEAGLKNVMVTAGYISAPMRDAVFEHIDAVNIDLKGFSDAFYRSWAHGDLATICDTIAYLHALRDVWLEVTTLVIPGQNDGVEMLRDEFRWFYEHLGDGVPLHLSAFFPRYRALEIESTPEATLEMARDLAHDAGLRDVYLGNVMARCDTLCRNCGEIVIRRLGYRIDQSGLVGGKCRACGEALNGVFL